MSGKPELFYFDAAARGEAIRLLYKHAGVEFVDTRIPHNKEKFIKEYKFNSKISFISIIK